ncbi:tyrosine-protein phosphatase [Flavobacterium sp.]|uniref:tyrosine-protein phosphatase n=1 Tax=Flavobacterium sp. TaxID=239 RepID=UPI003D1112F7
MFFFKKSKPVLKELIQDQFVDIHSHLLPGIDDGAKNIAETVHLINTLKEFGFCQFMATPHTFSGYYDNTQSSILETYQRTQALLIENHCHAQLEVASEYLMDDHFIKLFQNKEILTLKDNYVLVEMSYLNPPINLFDILFDLQVAGYKPVLAHPERYVFFHNQTEMFKKLKNSGCLLQMNLLSSVGYYGKNVQTTAQELLKQGLIDFVGSDVHHQKHLDAFNHKVEIKEIDALKAAISNNQFFKK